jgi:hypothetical protein
MTESADPIGATPLFTPGLRLDDPVTMHWLRQVALRLRREIAWSWHERGLLPATDQTAESDERMPAALPPFTDRVGETLDLARHWQAKRVFFETDPTGRYLTDELRRPPERRTRPVRRGSFAWVVDALDLDAAATFVLALALTPVIDSAAGGIIGACLNDPHQTLPTLTLAQRLWDRPGELLRLADPTHPLLALGLVQSGAVGQAGPMGLEWTSPLRVPPLVARQLLTPEEEPPTALVSLSADEEAIPLDAAARLVAFRLRAEAPTGLRIVPVRGERGRSLQHLVASIGAVTDQTVVAFAGDERLLVQGGLLNALATRCWLRDEHLLLDAAPLLGGTPERIAPETLPPRSIPLTLFLIAEHSHLATLPPELLLAPVEIAAPTYLERLNRWRAALGPQAVGLEQTIAECARRYRFSRGTIDSIARSLLAGPAALEPWDLPDACRAAVAFEVGDLAQWVNPRFAADELILPPRQERLFAEIVSAMRSLTEVHYGWGTAQVWNESGIAVLFAGPSGTGKTMAAEVLAVRLDLPLYRIDLSQVVDKYIGETEKNLKRLFDAADVCDAILFFDEADAIFGRRSEVRDSHDRYANLEISYLLERMERFKGLAILATNRKKDLDDAFLRRLRYVLDFPLPDVVERRRIWRRAIPPRVDATELNVDFLAARFPLTGGNIRSIVFNACLQGAAEQPGRPPRLTMGEVIPAVRREYDKLGRTIGLTQFGPYAELVTALERGEVGDERDLGDDGERMEVTA